MTTLDVNSKKYLMLRFFTFLGRMCMTFFPIYVDQIGYSKFDTGTLLTIFGTSFVAGSYLSRFVKKINNRKLFICAVYISAAVFVWLLLAFHYYILMIFAVMLIGAAQGIVNVNANYFLLTLGDSKYLATASRISINISAGIGGILSSFLMYYSYSYVILLSSISFVISMCIYCYLDDSHSTYYDNLTTKNKFSLLRTDVFLVCCLLALIVNVVFSQFYTFFPIYIMHYYHVSPKVFGSMSLINAFLIITCEIILVRCLSKCNDFIVLAVGSFLICVGFGLLPYGNGLIYLYFCFFIFVFGEMIYFPVSIFVPKLLCTSEEKLRDFISTYNVFFNIPTAIGPFIVGFVYDEFGGNVIWHISLLLSIVCAIIYISMYINSHHLTKPAMVGSI